MGSTGNRNEKRKMKNLKKTVLGKTRLAKSMVYNQLHFNTYHVLFEAYFSFLKREGLKWGEEPHLPVYCLQIQNNGTNSNGSMNDLYIIAKSIKLLEENIEENLHDLGSGDEFLYMAPKSGAKRRTKEKLDFKNLKLLYKGHYQEVRKTICN